MSLFPTDATVKDKCDVPLSSLKFTRALTSYARTLIIMMAHICWTLLYDKHLAELLVCIISAISLQSDVDTATIPFLQMRKWRQESLNKVPIVTQQDQ